MVPEPGSAPEALRSAELPPAREARVGGRRKGKESRSVPAEPARSGVLQRPASPSAELFRFTGNLTQPHSNKSYFQKMECFVSFRLMRNVLPYSEPVAEHGFENLKCQASAVCRWLRMDLKT